MILALAVAVMLFAAAIGGRQLSDEIADLPALPTLAADLRDVYSASAPTGWGLWLHRHAPAATAAKRALVALNGQIDARAEALLAILLNAAALGLLVGFLSRTWRVAGLALFAVAAVALFLPAGTRELQPLVTLGGATFIPALCLAHLWLMSRTRAGSWGWWGGFLTGAAAIAAGPVGAASAAALAVCSGADLWRRRDGRAPERADVWRFVANTLLVVVAAALLWGRMMSREAAADAEEVLSFARWPFRAGWAAPLTWAPALWCLGSALISRRALSRTLPLLAAWAAATLILVAGCGERVADTASLLCVTLLANAACACGVLAGAPRSRTARFAGATTWLLLVGIALLPPPATRPVSSETSARQTAALAAALRENDQALLRQMDGTDADRRAAAEIVAHRGFDAILPASIRPPLALRADPNAAQQGFRPGAAPELSERDSLPVFGTWTTAAGAASTGEFISEELTTSFPIVQFRIGGRLHEPDTLLRLRTASGREIGPLTGSLSAPRRWRRVNFAAPGEPFRVVARDASPTEWLAITAPVEVGFATRLLAKVSRPLWISPFWPAAALAGFIGTLLIPRVWRNASSAARRPPLIPWRAVPWVALVAYAAFFAPHADPTAGPNDSGGYVNSAKLLLEGEITAAPRMIFGAGAGETEAKPYLPITFREVHGRMAPEYPVGWPLEIAAFGKLLGLERGLRVLMVLQLVLGVVITQRLARVFGLPSGWAWFAAAIIGLSPVYLFHALQPVSDVPALVWVGLAVYWGWLARERVGYAVPAGLATALAVMIRPANLLCVVPIFLCLAGRWRQLLLWAAAGVPGAAWLCWYQQSLYGSWRRTGYDILDTNFGLEYVLPTLRSYAVWLPEFLTPLVVLGLALPFLRSVAGRVRLVLTAWVIVFIAFYACWWCTWDSWFNMRFVLPAFPAMIIAALLVIRHLGQRWGFTLFEAAAADAPVAAEAGSATPVSKGGSAAAARAQLATVAIVVLALGFLAIRTAQRQVTYWMWSNHKPGNAARWAGRHLPANAVVFAKHITGSLFHYTDLTFVRLDHPNAHDPAFHERVARTGRPMYAITFHWETREFDRERQRGTGYPDLPGAWERIASLEENDITVWRKKDERSVRE